MKHKNQNKEHILKFFFFSVSAGFIQTLSFTLMYEVFTFVYWVSYLVALILSILWNFTLNRKYTFKSAANVPVAMMKVGMYYSVFLPLSTWWGDELTELNINGYIVLLGTMVINLITEFIYTKYFVYRNQINTAVQEG